jgi:hypothetical protein
MGRRESDERAAARLASLHAQARAALEALA